MLLRDAVTPPPDLRSARRVGIAVGITAAIVFGGGAIVALNVDRPRMAIVEQVPTMDVARMRYDSALASAQQLQLAQRELAGFAFETFPQWAADNPKRACPRHLLELNFYDPTLHAVDPWGRPYQFSCTPHLWARSAGPDRMFDTGDDLTSSSAP